MPDWLVNMIVGLASVIFGFVAGFFTKTVNVKIQQKVKGNNNKQTIGDINNEK